MTPNQELKLYEYIKGLIGLPFEYGRNDCPLLAAGALDCMDGGNRRGEMTGLWHDKPSAWRYLRTHGDIRQHLLDYGCEPVAGGVNYAQPGDLILMERTLAHDRRWHSVGICLGQTVAIMTEDSGLIKVLMQDIPPVKQVLKWPSQQ